VGTRLVENAAAAVTGSARGIGYAIARRLAEHGAKIVLSDLDGQAVERACTELTAAGAAVIAVEADVRRPADVGRIVTAAVETFGSLEIFVNNAGLTRDATLRKMTMEDWEDVLDVHLTGTFLGTQSAGAVMREQRRGAIVNISSISAKVGFVGQANYSAAKAGVVALTKVAAKELAPHGVRVNAIQPGLIRTDMTLAMRQDIWDQKLSEVPLGRAGEPEEVADVALFLASSLSSYVTGAVVEVTGGRYM
jgi:3-oxoacyl-[acyl-carrier protein] reductase